VQRADLLALSRIEELNVPYCGGRQALCHQGDDYSGRTDATKRLSRITKH
jgi:hypothetical protein